MLQGPVRWSRLSRSFVVAAALAAAAAPALAQPAGEASGPSTPPPDEVTVQPGPATGTMLDWLQDGPRDRRWGRMLIEAAVLLGAMETHYWINKTENMFDFQYDADWHNVRERLITLQAWKLDDNYYETNAWRHPAQGGLSYLFARSNGFSALESYAVALTQSAAWELIGEFKEEVSVNDIILTPRAGSVLGEATWQLGLFFLRGERVWPYKIAGNLGTFGKGVWDYLDGRPRPRARTINPIGLPADVPHRFEASIAGARWSAGGEVRPLVRAAISTELVLIPDYDKPGREQRLYAAPAYSSIRVEAARDDLAITDFKLFVRTGITSWHRKDLKRSSGYSILYSLGSAYEYSQHASPGRFTRRTRDQIAIGHIGGGTVDLTVRRPGVQVRAMADVYGDFALVRNHAIDAYREAHPDAYVRSTITRDNYHHALGLTARGQVVASRGGLRLGVAYQQDWFRSIQGLDRRQEDVMNDYALVDRRLEARAWMSYEFPLRPGLALGFEGAMEVRRRAGDVQGMTQSTSEQRQLVGVQLVF